MSPYAYSYWQKTSSLLVIWDAEEDCWFGTSYSASAKYIYMQDYVALNTRLEAVYSLQKYIIHISTIKYSKWNKILKIDFCEIKS